MKKIKWKYSKTNNCWEGTVKGDNEPLIFIHGSLCVTDIRESRKSQFISPKHYKITGMSLEESKKLAEDLVTGENFEEHEKNRLAWIAKEEETARLIRETDELIKRLSSSHSI